MNVMKEWLVLLESKSEKQSGNLESLQIAINRSLWFQRELVSRFLKEDRAHKASKAADAVTNQKD